MVNQRNLLVSLKKATIVGALLISTTGLTAQAHAEIPTQAKQNGVFALSTIIGTVAGGPIGFVVGSAGGAWLGDQIAKADRVTTMEDKIRNTQMTIKSLEEKLSNSQTASSQYAQMVLEQLQLEMLFKTNASDLTNEGERRLALVADFLARNQTLHVRLDGYTDPRGDSAYNQVLSKARVDTVANALEQQGVNAQRIERHAHGKSGSISTPGDYDAYALERVVRIQLSQPQTNQTLANVNITK